MVSLYYCKYCDEYTLQNRCPRCNEKTIINHPARFSPQDRYGTYRRTLKRQQKGEE